MIEADFAELELLADNITDISSGMDEMYIQMRSLREEMASNPEFQAYPQCNTVMESFSAGIESVFRMNEMLMSLRNIMLGAPDEYKIQENRFREMLEGFIVTLSSLQMDVSAAAATVMPVEVGEEVIAQNRIQQLVAESSSEMQLTNIAAITQAVKEEYCLDEVNTTSAVVQEIANEAEASSLSSVLAESVKIETEDEVSQIDNEFTTQVVHDKEALENSVASAEKIKTDTVIPESSEIHN